MVSEPFKKMEMHTSFHKMAQVKCTLYSDILEQICSHPKMAKYCIRWDSPDQAMESAPCISVTLLESNYMHFAVWVSSYPRAHIYIN